MPLRALLPAVLAAAVLAAAAPAWSWAAITPQQRAQLRSIEERLRKIPSLVRSDKLDEAVEQYRAAQADYRKLSEGDPPADLARLLSQTKNRLLAGRKRLEAKGAQLPPLDEPGAPSANDVSFSNQIRPILLNRCGACHVERNRGGLSMASYAALIQGAASGSVVTPGKAAESRLVEVIATGEMPKGGGQVPAAERELLAAWVNQGARFDGRDPRAPLAPVPPESPAEVPPRRATGNETVSFSGQIAPLVVEHCLGCHGLNQGPAQLRLGSYRGVLAGGQSGAAIVPGKPEESLLVQKLRGTAPNGQRMPLRRAALEPSAIALIETWIREGAVLDGTDSAADEPLEVLANRHLALSLAPEQLHAKRLALAMAHWQLALPEQPPRQAAGRQILVVGGGDEGRLSEIAATADEVARKLESALGLGRDTALVSGVMTLFVFDRRTDYVEFAHMVEKRDPSKHEYARGRYDALDPYLCVVAAASDAASRTLEVDLGQALAEVYLAALGQQPRWFREGCARALAARLAPKSAQVGGWDQSLAGVLAAIEKPQEFLSANLPPAEAELLAYSFCSYLISGKAQFRQLLAALADEQPFDEAFREAYGRAPEQLIGDWQRTVRRRPR